MSANVDEPNSARPRTLSLWQSVVSSSVGATITTLVVTPLDMIKTRLQAESLGMVQDAKLCTHSECGKLHPGSQAWFEVG